MISMSRSSFPFLLLLILASSYTPARSNEEGHIEVTISNKGLDFVKDLLIEKAESSLVPLELPDIEKSAKIRVVGKVHMVLSSIVIERIDVISSTVQTGDTGIVIAVSGATANLSMDWSYSYKTWLLPITVSDKGAATIQVEGMEADLTLGLTTVQGSLKVDALDCGCNVKDISIKLDGGASWLYQGLVDAFEGKISSSIENAISKKLKDEIEKINSLLNLLPKEVPVAHIATLNVTFVDDPELSESSLDLTINGLLSPIDEIVLSSEHQSSLQSTLSFKTVNKMVRISLHEDVLKSASSVFFYADKMHWNVDKAVDQSFLNTAEWRFIVPQLYKMYPNDDICLNLSVASPPSLKMGKEQLEVIIPLDVVIDVTDDDEVIPVACISVVINASVYPEISRDSVAGSVNLNDFSMSLKWSRIGDLHMYLIKRFVSTIMNAIILPYVNLRLDKGFRLPSFHGYELQHAQILCTDSWIVISTDIASVKQFNIP